MKAATLDFTQPPGFSEFTGMDADFLTQSRPLVCDTIAMMFTNPCEDAPNGMSASIVLMALYAGGANACLTKKQFRYLERRIKRYIELMQQRFGSQSMNFAMARYVLSNGIRRAKYDGIIGDGANGAGEE